MSDSRKRFEEWWNEAEHFSTRGERMSSEYPIRVAFYAWSARDSEVERLREALKDLLALPIATQELHYLDRGIGTATQNAAWLRARAAMSSQDKESA